MKLTFLGTRGYIDARTGRHRRHSALMLAYKLDRIMIDCGEDWRGALETLSPDAVVLTHAHPDHAYGLRDGADCPVYATAATWSGINRFPLLERMTVVPRKPFGLGGISFEAFPVVHSLRAPAVGYRVSAGKVTIFYVPDVIDIIDRITALSGSRLYVGDGASLARPIVRRSDKHLVGHTTVREQIRWCEEAGVNRALFTHCGSQIVRGEEEATESRVHQMGLERSIDAAVAYDGLEVTLR